MSPDSRTERLGSEILGESRGCPEAEELRLFHDGALGPEAARAAEGHVEGCRACRAALEFLRSEETMAGGERATAALPDEVEARSEALIGALAGGTSGRRATTWWPTVLRLAAGISIVTSISLVSYVWLGRQVPEEDLGEFRGAAALDLLEPIGETAASPATLRWAAHPLATSYRVILLDSGMDEVWTRETSEATPELQLDAEARAALRPGAWFTWQVVALGPLGREIARSPAGHFMIAPGPPTR
jgi:hypothetical protein